MNIGIIGCGIITQEAHVPALLRLKEKIKVVALCNHSEDKAMRVKKLLALPELPIYKTWQEMIQNRSDLDAVLIALPITLNYEVSKACLEAGIAVLCEKPVAAESVQAEKTLQWKTPDTPLYMTGENFQFKRSTQEAIKIIKSGRIGKLHSIQMNIFRFTFVDNKYNKTLWRSNNEYPGGYLMDGGVHNIHTLQQIAGPIESVMAKTLSINPKLGTHDTGFAIFKHASGVTTSYTMALQHSAPAEKLKLFCTNGSLFVTDNEIIIMNEKGDVETITVENENTFYLEWLDFYTAFTTHSKASLSQEIVVRDVKVVEKMLESSKTGKEVFL